MEWREEKKKGEIKDGIEGGEEEGSDDSIRGVQEVKAQL